MEIYIVVTNSDAEMRDMADAIDGFGTLLSWNGTQVKIASALPREEVLSALNQVGINCW